MFAIFRRIRFLYKKLKLQRLRYSLPFLVLIAYTVGGAYIFRYFELKEDEERRIRYRQNTEYAFKRTLNRMLEVHCENGLEDTDRALQNRHVKEHLFWLMDYLNLTQVIEERSESSPWTWMGAMFYAGQLYTTIGYGLPATQTSGGRLASIVYIMIGIPLFLIILAEVGKLLSRGLRKLYKKMHKMKRIPEAARKMSEPMKAIYHMTTSLASTAVGPIALQILNSNNNPMLEEEKLEAKRKAEIKALSKASKGEKKSFPIPWALTILIVWILFSAALFCIWENEWGYMTSVYFFFVSISTVGLGDLVPTKPDMMIVNFFMILIGLALLSMCVNLIQEALQKLIERLIEQYIDEIEKIAAVVTNNEINEFTEELEPFNVEINEMSLPIATLNIEQPKVVETGGIGRSVKDWFAERASSILLNKIYPISNSSSSDSEQEEEENINLSNLEEVIVKTEQAKARITINKHSFDENKIEDENLPQIEIHEGTPLRIEEIPKIKLEKAQIHNKGIIYGTPDSTPTREGISFQKRNKKPPKMPKDYAGALLKFSAPTMQAIRAIENSRLKTGQIGNDFKSRLFAFFATNQRFAEIVENNAPSPKKMVSSSIQTSPRQSPIRSLPQKSCQLRRLGCGIESMDSTSSDLNVTRTTTNDASDPSCSANDLDSLYSNTYFDVCFGNYHTDSVPSLMAITPLLPQSSSQTAMANTIAKRLGERRSSLALKRRFSDKLFFGLFGKNKNILKQKPKFIVGGNAKLGRYDSDDDDNDSGLLNQNENQQHSRRKRRPLSQSFSSPSFPFINPQCLSPTDKNNKTTTTPASIPTTPIIHLTDMSINRKFKLGMIPSPSPAERISNFNQITKPSTSTENILMQGKRPRRNSRICGIGSNPLGCVPLHHRTLSTRRRFSAYASISPPLLNRWGENSDDEMKGKDEEEKEEEEEAKEEEKNQNLDEKRKENYKKQQISVETKSEENIIEELENNSDNNEKIKEITTKTNSENSKINEKEDKIGIKEQKE